MRLAKWGRGEAVRCIATMAFHDQLWMVLGVPPRAVHANRIIRFNVRFSVDALCSRIVQSET